MTSKNFRCIQWRINSSVAAVRGYAVFCTAFVAAVAGCNTILGLEEGEPFPPEAGIGAGGAGGVGMTTTGTAGSGFGGCSGVNVVCDAGCVDLATDPGHCGACGAACKVTEGEVCSGHCSTREWALWGVPDAPIFTPSTNTALESGTQLTWQRLAPASNYDQASAKAYCAALDLDGVGWRLPTRIELQSIVDYSKAPLAIDTTVFPNTMAELFWTASPAAGGPGKGWAVAFGAGLVTSVAVTTSARARCVR